MLCKLGRHRGGTVYEYEGNGLVYELCAKCDRTLDAIPLEDFPYAEDLMFFLELQTV